ncbi:hypothetical protein [Corynebacterium parakroppenstedtii]|uniref:hypothetical protein n=1 Tax=Corynebacterium parakroppenstedtii TaxID=2828363 RepID=UPI001C8D7201|nr:hypothetical protein [Corynebacterium parakroppenstedtii]MBY0797842.1 hypothetical protein [Corynebacterium parakroppenstedtii]
MNWWSIISGIIGTATGIGGLIIAILAKHDSKKANDISQRTHQAALNSNTLATEANRIAIDARQLAQEANTISLRAEQRDTEVNNVSWDYNWVDPSTCHVTNTGHDEALRVSITVAVDGEHVSRGPIDIKPGGSVNIALPKLLDKLRRNEAEFLVEQDGYRASSRRPWGNYVPVPPIYLPLKFNVVVTVQWLTLLGKQREKIFEETNCDFIL